VREAQRLRPRQRVALAARQRDAAVDALGVGEGDERPRVRQRSVARLPQILQQLTEGVEGGG